MNKNNQSGMLMNQLSLFNNPNQPVNANKENSKLDISNPNFLKNQIGIDYSLMNLQNVSENRSKVNLHSEVNLKSLILSENESKIQDNNKEKREVNLNVNNKTFNPNSGLSLNVSKEDEFKYIKSIELDFNEIKPIIQNLKKYELKFKKNLQNTEVGATRSANNTFNPISYFVKKYILCCFRESKRSVKLVDELLNEINHKVDIEKFVYKDIFMEKMINCFMTDEQINGINNEIQEERTKLIDFIHKK